MGGQTNSNQNGVRDAVASLLGQLMPGTSGGKISGAQAGANGSFFAPAILSFLQGNNPEQAGKPKAYINWLFLDEQFNYQAGNGSGAESVRAENVYNPLHERSKNLSNPLRVGKTGYLYIYTSNESSLSVYFDNLKVKHHRGPLLEETHYYPFGLTMAGISSKAAGRLENKFKYGGKELSNNEFIDGSGLGMYDFHARNYDPQLGRFWSIDPMTHLREWLSQYNYCQNNPLRRIDPTGALDGEYELDDNKKWQKVSTKGDDIGVDFYHKDGVDSKGKATQTTYITDRKGNWNKINNGRYALKGEVRSNDVNWETIYNEWSEGYDPERSVFEGDHPANLAIKENYLYKKAAKDFDKSGESKMGKEVNFWYLWDNIGTGTNMQVQMMGSYNASFYKLGARTFSLIQDSKSRSSFYYHLPVENYPRDYRLYDIPDGWMYNNKESNTYQTYIFFR